MPRFDFAVPVNPLELEKNPSGGWTVQVVLAPLPSPMQCRASSRVAFTLGTISSPPLPTPYPLHPLPLRRVDCNVFTALHSRGRRTFPVSSRMWLRAWRTTLSCWRNPPILTHSTQPCATLARLAPRPATARKRSSARRSKARRACASVRSTRWAARTTSLPSGVSYSASPPSSSRGSCARRRSWRPRCCRARSSPLRPSPRRAARRARRRRRRGGAGRNSASRRRCCCSTRSSSTSACCGSGAPQV